MQFADFMVSTALQMLSRGLLKISDGEDPLSCGDLKAMAITAERLQSLWQMAQWSISRLQFDQAQADLREIASLCSPDGVMELAALERLRERAESLSQDLTNTKLARSLDMIDRGLASSRPDADDVRDRLNTLFQLESSRWREYAPLRQIPQEDLIEHGMLRAFQKSGALSRKLDRMEPGSGHRASVKKLRRAGRWTRHCVHHLELLRPALSEQGRTRSWHLSHLSAKLDEQWALERLAQAALAMGFKPKTAERLEQLFSAQRERLDAQRRKLSVGAFAGQDAAYRAEVSAAVGKLGLESITLLPLEGIQGAAKALEEA